VVVVLALGGLALALWFFTANDDATTSAPAAIAPGTRSADPVAWAPELREGNVLVAVGDPGQVAAVRRLAREVAGTDWSPQLRQTGQAIRVLDLERCVRDMCDLGRLPAGASGNPVDIMAYAHDRALTADRADDPELRTFLEYWLGRAAG
jgi:hypothetical protein